MNRKRLISLWVVGVLYMLFVFFQGSVFGGGRIEDVEELIIFTVPFLVIVGLLWVTFDDRRS